MTDNNDIKAAILAKVNHDMRERDKSVQAIWYAMEGKLLTEQDAMFTLFTRGYLGEQAVNREEVVQSILRAGDESRGT